MIKKVEITIRNNATGEYLKLPIIPERLPYTDGPAQFNSVKIVSLGNVNFFDGVDLDNFTLSSFFPGRYDPGYCQVSAAELKTPETYRNWFSSLKDSGGTCQVIVPAYGISKTMQVASFDWEGVGAEGDIEYTLEFSEGKDIAPQQLTPGGQAPAVGDKAQVDRPAAPEKVAGKTYTVKAGDTLTAIAKRLGIANWRTGLYEPNKAVIGNDPGKIKPGQVLTI